MPPTPTYNKLPFLFNLKCNIQYKNNIYYLNINLHM